MKCKNCGEEIENGLMYCPKCGESIQLVPDYNVLEEELLSRVVEDKNKSKDDKFATGVYKYAENPETSTTEGTIKAQPGSNRQVFTKKICIILFVAFICISVIAAFTLIPYMGNHTYDNIMNKAVDAENNAQYAKALGYYEEAYEIEGDSFEVIYGLGRMYYRVKDYENAVVMLKEALGMDPSNKKIYTYLLECYEALGDMDGIYELADDVEDEEIKKLISAYIMLPPAFNIEPGQYDEDLIIQLSCDGDYQIFYTLNGKNPTTSGKLYNKPITLKEGTTVIKAVTQNKSGEYSEVVSAEYVISYPSLSIPVVTPTDGIYTEKIMISIQVPDGCKAYYTWDGTDPVSNGIQYVEPFPILEGSSVLSVIIVDEKGNTSPLYRGDYIYQP